MKRLSMVLLALVFVGTQTGQAQEKNVLQGDVATAARAQEEEAADITAVSVDGMEYSFLEYLLQFGDQPLHWVLDPDAEAQGMLIAFTTEEELDAEYGIEPLAEEEAARDDPENPFPSIFDGASFQGRSWIVRQSIANLGAFNEKTSSAIAPGSRGLKLYEFFNFQGCSFNVPGFSGVVNLGRYPRCKPGTNWDNKTSSVKLW
jgi:hypothetical protein